METRIQKYKRLSKSFGEQKADLLTEYIEFVARENVATKEDIANVKHDIANVRTELKDVKYDMIKWYVVMAIAQILAILIAVYTK